MNAYQIHRQKSLFIGRQVLWLSPGFSATWFEMSSIFFGVDQDLKTKFHF